MGDSTNSKPQVSPFHLTAEDHAVLSQTDDEYTLLSWDFIKSVIAAGDLAKLTRTPSQLRAYLQWSKNIKAEYGSVSSFLLTQRLKWTPLTSSKLDDPPFAVVDPNTPLSNPADYLILRNDWPYGLEPGIYHLCVWTKHTLPVDLNADAALTPEGHKLVGDFVRTAVEEKLGIVGQDKVIWFKNPGATSSIRAIDHVHILIRGIESSELAKVVNDNH